MSFFKRPPPVWERLLAFAATASAVAGWIEETGMDTLQDFAVPVYVFLTVILGGWFLWSISGWINGLRPTRKFAALHSNLYTATWNLSFSVGHFRKADLESLRYRLKKLGIFLPDSSEDLSWVIPELLGYAKDGRIEKAQELTKKWK